MTSGPTRKDAEDVLENCSLEPENVIIFEQGVFPCVKNDGKIIMEENNEITVAPDGNGDLYLALITNSVLKDLQRRKIEPVHAYCVDNPLVRISDPTFIRYSFSRNLDIATKVVRKWPAEEPVGLYVLTDGKPGVIKNSEISERECGQRVPNNGDGGNTVLRFRAANSVNHYCS